MKLFVARCTARAAAELTGGDRNTFTDYFMSLRMFIASKLSSYELSGEVEAAEGYFSGGTFPCAEPRERRDFQIGRKHPE